MSATYVVCPHCQAGNPSIATVCWMCRSALSPVATTATSAAPADTRTLAQIEAGTPPAPVPKTEATPVAWAVTLAVCVVLSLAISAELARVAPGLLILFLFVDLPVIGALLFTVAKMWAGEAQKTNAETAVAFATRAVTGVAIGIGGVFALLALLFLFAIAILVIAFAICVALAAANPGRGY